MTSSKIQINDFFAKFLHNVNNPGLKGLCKFPVDIPTNSRVTATQSLENLHTFILRQPCYAQQLIFPNKIIENSQSLFWLLTPSLFVQISSNLV